MIQSVMNLIEVLVLQDDVRTVQWVVNLIVITVQNVVTMEQWMVNLVAIIVQDDLTMYYKQEILMWR